MRPDRAIAEVQVKSVKKKLKDKAFARGVNRDDVRRGAEELGVELAEHIEFVRDAMATIADQLELPRVVSPGVPDSESVAVRGRDEERWRVVRACHS